MDYYYLLYICYGFIVTVCSDLMLKKKRSIQDVSDSNI